MPQVMVLRHVFDGESLVVLGKAHEGVQQRHVDQNVVANLTVVARRRGRTVHFVLYFVVLAKSVIAGA